MKRKIFAALLAVMMVVTMLPLSVMAAAAPEPVNTTRLAAHIYVYKNGDTDTWVASKSANIPYGKSVEEVCGTELKELIETNKGTWGGIAYGWYTDGSWTCYTDENPDTVAVPYDLKETDYTNAVWFNLKVMIYDLVPVVFYDSYGEGNTELKSQLVEVNKTIGEADGFEMPDVPTKTGYTFSNWRGDWEGNKYKTADDVKAITVNGWTNLFAEWTANDYTVTFDVNGGDLLENATKSVTYDKAYGELPVPTKTGYVFKGWALEDGREVTAESIVSIPNDHKLVAQWRRGNYGLTLVNIDAKGTDEKTDVYYDKPYTDLPTPEAEGYTFEGWFLDENCTEDNRVTSGETLVQTASAHKLYAKWTPITYTLNFDPNGGENVNVSSVPNKKSLSYDTEFVMPATTREGYTFQYWVDEDGTEYKAGDTIIKLSTKHQDQINLTAVWEATRTRIYLELNGGTLSSDAVVNQTADGRYYFGAYVDKAYGYCSWVGADKISKSGYTFDGWYKDEALTTVVDPYEIYGQTSNSTIYAKWTANTYTVTFKANGGMVTPKSKVVTYDDTYGELPTPTMYGHEFKGWFLGDQQIKADTTVETAGNHTLIARWDDTTPAKPAKPEKPVEPKFESFSMPNLRSIVIDTTEGGKTGVASGKAAAAFGSTYRLTLTPEEGYEIGEVLVNGKAVEANKNNKISFVVKGNTYVEVEFVEIAD